MSWGIVNKVAPMSELMDTARALAAEICLSAPLSIAAVLDIIRVTEDLSIADGYAAMRKNEAYVKAINSEDAMEGPNAFAEKRDPVWKGK
jgi:crotonobetainyl-CoA hydratase